MVVLLKVWSRPIQNGHRTIIFCYGLAHLLNGLPVMVTVQVNMNRLRTILKIGFLMVCVGLTRELSIFLILNVYFINGQNFFI